MKPISAIISTLGVPAEPKISTAHCETHGAFEARCYLGNAWSKCPTCSVEADARAIALREQQSSAMRLRAREIQLGQSGIPARFQDRTLQSFVATTDAQRKALTFAQEYAADFGEVLRVGRSALFVGKPGTGKTHLAAGIGMHIMREQNRTVLFTTVMRAIRRVKDSWSKDNGESESQAIATLVSPDLLILDEVGVQFGSAFEKNILFDVLNERYEKRLPAIMLSNLPMVEVTAYLGARVIDRMREDGGAQIVFDWESHRGTK